MGGKEDGGCLLDGDVFLELKSVCNKISVMGMYFWNLKVYATKSVTSISET